MKKVIVILITLLLMVPTLSYANNNVLVQEHQDVKLLDLSQHYLNRSGISYNNESVSINVKNVTLEFIEGTMG